MEFCEFCRSVLQEILGTKEHNFNRVKPESFKASAARCRLCEFIFRSGATSEKWAANIDIEFERCQQREELKFYEGKSTMNLKSTNDRVESLRFAIWCDEGSPAEKLTVTYNTHEKIRVERALTTQRPILTNDPLETSLLISNWLHVCLSNHNGCLKTLGGLAMAPGDVVDLPTRLLYIESITPEPNVKLVESKGSQGRYCILSHCWGPEHKRPLRTVEANLEEHLVNIPHDKFPKTFREALIITKGVGIDYLWIDSICIIQDNHEDWEREAAKMGTLYEKATLMFAAAGASDSTEGCLVAQRPGPATFTVPLINSENLTMGQCYISRLPQGASNPWGSLLNKRAWVMQERYMSRRKVFFMPGGLVWSCREFIMDERNTYVSPMIKIHADLSWSALLSEYSDMRLTRVTDWLPAIQGIATEMGKTKRRPFWNPWIKPEIDRGRYRFGVWENSLPFELMWLCKSRSSMNRKVPNVSSWSWAKLEGTKEWCLEPLVVKEARRTYDTLTVTDSGCLNIRGYLGINDHVPEREGYCCAGVPVPVRRWLFDNTVKVSPEALFFRAKRGRQPPVQMVLSGNSPCKVLGFADFDERPKPKVFFSILSSTRRYDIGRMQPFDPLKTVTIQRSPAPEDSLGAGVILQKSTNVQTWEIMVGDVYYYALLLEPVDESLSKFRRVGIGLMYQAAWEAMDKSVRSFEII